MELLAFGALTTALVELYKWISGKFGKEVTNLIIYLVVFVLCLIWAGLTKGNLISTETLVFIGQVGAYAIALYEIVIKWLLGNVIMKK